MDNNNDPRNKAKDDYNDDDIELARLKQKKLEEMMNTASHSDTLNNNNTTVTSSVVDLDNSNFDQVISKDGLTLIDFWAEWCGPCKLMHPVFERMARKYKQIQFARVNVDQNQPIAIRFGVQSIPTFMMFKAGRLIDQMMGAVGEPGINMIAKKHMLSSSSS